LGGYGEEVRENPAQIAPALKRGARVGAQAAPLRGVNIWVDPREYAPGTKPDVYK